MFLFKAEYTKLKVCVIGGERGSKMYFVETKYLIFAEFSLASNKNWAPASTYPSMYTLAS